MSTLPQRRRPIQARDSHEAHPWHPHHIAERYGLAVQGAVLVGVRTITAPGR